jgi:hypothetical protein
VPFVKTLIFLLCLTASACADSISLQPFQYVAQQFTLASDTDITFFSVSAENVTDPIIGNLFVTSDIGELSSPTIYASTAFTIGANGSTELPVTLSLSAGTYYFLLAPTAGNGWLTTGTFGEPMFISISQNTEFPYLSPFGEVGEHAYLILGINEDVTAPNPPPPPSDVPEPASLLLVATGMTSLWFRHRRRSLMW